MGETNDEADQLRISIPELGHEQRRPYLTICVNRQNQGPEGISTFHEGGGPSVSSQSS